MHGRRRQISPRLGAGILFLAILGLGVGCGRQDGKDAATGPTLRLTTARLRGFDPALAGDEPTVLAVGRIYEGLVQYDYQSRPYRVVPLLAESLPEVSEDGRVWTFVLRRGICFSDDPCFTATGGRGREVTAADVVYSLKRIADTKVGSGGYWTLRGKIEELDAFRAASQGEEPTDYDRPVEGLKALDRHTLLIRLTEPYPQLLWVLAMPYAFVVPREAVEFYGRDFVNHPVGTGPYVLAAARPNYRYEYRVNPRWVQSGRGAAETARLGAAAEPPLPQIPRIVTSVVGDPSTAWLMFLAGELDRVTVSREQWDSIITPQQQLRPELVARGIVLDKAPQLAVSYIALNMDDPVLGTNRRLRQALSCAFDGEAWRKFFNGRVAPATGPVPPGVAGHRDAPLPYADDVERGRRLLAEAGYPEGRDPATGRRLKLTLDLGAADNPEVRQSAELIASFFDRLGIVLELNFHHWPAFLQKIERRESQMFALTWLGDYPDAQNFLQLFASENASPGPNRSNYRSEIFDALYRQLIQMPDSPERADLCRAAAEIVLEDCPWILTGYPMSFSVRHARLQNVQSHDFPWSLEKYWQLTR